MKKIVLATLFTAVYVCAAYGEGNWQPDVVFVPVQIQKKISPVVTYGIPQGQNTTIYVVQPGNAPLPPPPSPTRVTRIVTPQPSAVTVTRYPVVTGQTVTTQTYTSVTPEKPRPVYRPTGIVGSTATSAVVSDDGIVTLLTRRPATKEDFAVSGTVLAQYNMNVTGYYTAGNTPVYNAYGATCSVYTDGTLFVRILYPDNSGVIDFKISNPVNKVRENHALYRTTYNTVVNTGRSVLPGPLTCDVWSNGTDINEIKIYGDNHYSVTINLSRSR